MSDLVDQATSDVLNLVDWSANMQCVDLINATSNGEVLREVVKHLVRRLSTGSTRVLMNALTLIETLVMNCHSLFHQEVACASLMSAMANIARVMKLDV